MTRKNATRKDESERPKKKAFITVVASIITLSFVGVVFFFVGYEVSSQKLGYNSSTASPSNTFYASVTEVRGNYFAVAGLEVNDVNHRGDFTFSVDTDTELTWRGAALKASDFEAGDTVSITYSGVVLETDPAQLTNVLRVQLLDGEV